MLKSLELFGFKSFADRTKFDFSPGVTCVVGPNGSGKSNVVDSLKWILGDQSPKSLRGKEMTDVIFNGSGHRKPAGFAEATLVFENSKRILALDQDEVLVGRRIYRSGEAEYLINRIPARLKDVRDLFMGTGAGTAAYNIIEQGRVDQLLQSTPVARRAVFEEAAGVSRFKARKVDAERKLERVAQNLLRLTDIVQELEGRLNTMRSQAAKAAKFRELSQELQQLRVGLAADDFRDSNARLDEIQTQHAEQSKLVATLSAEAQETETKQRQAEAALSVIEDELRAVERQEAEIRESMAGHEATLRHQQSRLVELDGDTARLIQEEADLQNQAQEVAGELQVTEGTLQEFANELAAKKLAAQHSEARLVELAAEINGRRDEIEKQRQRQLELVRATSMFDNRVSALDSQRTAILEGRQRDTQRRERLTQEIQLTQHEVAQTRVALVSESERMQELRDQYRRVQLHRQTLTSKQQDAQLRIVELREKRSAVAARKQLLEDLERRQEGLGIGVKEILARAKGSEGPPWNHVIGHVVDLLDVDLEHAALVEVALGSRAQLIVLEEAEPLVNYLLAGRGQVTGRVGFLAMTRPGESGGWDIHPDLTGLPGVINRADQYVRAGAGSEPVAARLLGDTWIVSSLEAAVTLARGYPQCRYVTLQGELLDSTGAIYVGPVRSESSLVSRKSELRGIKTDLTKLDRALAQQDQTILACGAELAKLDTAAESVQVDLDFVTGRFSELKSTLTGQELDLERLQRSQDELARELQTTDEQVAQLSTQLEAARAERLNSDQQLQSLQEELQRAEAELSKLDRDTETFRAEVASNQEGLSEYESRLQELQSTRSRLDQERFQRDMHREEVNRRLKAIDTRRTQIGEEIGVAQAAIDACNLQRDEFAQEVARVQADRDAARQERLAIVDRDLKLRHQLREIKEQLHALDMEQNQLRLTLAALIERIREEYQFELAEVAAGDISARAVYLRELADTALPEGYQTPENTDPFPTPAEIRQELEERVNRARRKLKQLGQVNADSLKELDDLESRYSKLAAQLQDLVEAKNTLEEIIRRINSESKRLFQVTFDEIRGYFQELFRKLFGGGEGDIILENAEDVLECGIDVVARPPGKELRSISLLSGGEKTMTAVAMLLALFKTRPSPFCILDEVDAALDEGNVDRYLNVIREFRNFTQFIVVTHHKRTMSGADVLYGVTMEEAGVSKRMSVKFEDVAEDGNIKSSRAA